MTTEKHDLSVDMGRASVFGLLMGLLAVLPFGLLYGFVQDGASISLGIEQLLFPFWQFLLVLAAGIVVHELLHGITWSLAGKVPHSKMKYGFVWWALTPYCHSTVPLPARAYRWGAFMPALALGFVPMIVALFTGWGWLFVFGIVLTVAAGGDFLVLWQIRHVKAATPVEDHPSRAGCYVYVETSAPD